MHGVLSQKKNLKKSWRKVSVGREKREKNAVNSGHLVPSQHMQAAQTNLMTKISGGTGPRSQNEHIN